MARLVVHVAGQGSCFVDASSLLSFSFVIVQTLYSRRRRCSRVCAMPCAGVNVALSGMWPQCLESCETRQHQQALASVGVCCSLQTCSGR